MAGLPAWLKRFNLIYGGLLRKTTYPAAFAVRKGQTHGDFAAGQASSSPPTEVVRIPWQPPSARVRVSIRFFRAGQLNSRQRGIPIVLGGKHREAATSKAGQQNWRRCLQRRENERKTRERKM